MLWILGRISNFGRAILGCGLLGYFGQALPHLVTRVLEGVRLLDPWPFIEFDTPAGFPSQGVAVQN